MNLTTNQEEYWVKHWHETRLGIAPEHHPVRRWIEHEVSTVKDRSCLEIGCYPGKFLAVFGKKGYVLHGIDIYPQTKSTLVKWLKHQGYNVGTFYDGNFLSFQTSQLYNIVCSFGFIEHFNNWEEILYKHIKLTKKGGIVIVEVPNLKSPLYSLLYRILEPRVLENHVVAAMDLRAICAVLENGGCSIRKADYIGYFYFRFVTRHMRLLNITAAFINLFRPLFELLPNSVYARYIGVIAVKR